MSTVITTYSRIEFDPFHPEADGILPTDIAHALSLLCRAGGHFAHFYSVGQHCLNCQKEAKARGYSSRMQLILLLHDASEAYLSDITRPVKACLFEYLAIEDTLQTAIYRKFLKTPPSESELALMKAVDDTLLHFEFSAIMGETVFDPAPTLHADCLFDFVPFETVENDYLETLNTLLGEIHMNETIKTLIERRSCRRYTDEKIPEEILDEILKAGTYAPTGRNRQAPIIVAVEDPDTVKALSALNARGWNSEDPFYGAPTVVVVLSDPTVSTYLHDGALVMGNLMNAAHALGVDSCYIFRAKEMFESPEGKAYLKKWGIPEHYVGIGNCILGYGAEGGKREAGPRKDGYIIKVK